MSGVGSGLGSFSHIKALGILLISYPDSRAFLFGDTKWRQLKESVFV